MWIVDLRTAGGCINNRKQRGPAYVTGKRTGSNEGAHKKIIRKERELTKRVTGIALRIPGVPKKSIKVWWRLPHFFLFILSLSIHAFRITFIQ
jgi:hypothetical protein